MFSGLGILVGYDSARKGYRLLDPDTNKICVSRSVRIIERNPSVVYITPIVTTKPSSLHEDCVLRYSEPVTSDDRTIVKFDESGSKPTEENGRISAK